MGDSWYKSGVTLSELIKGVGARLVSGSGDTLVTDLTEDSRQVVVGCMFVARRGEHFDGRNYVPAAVRAGAVAILSDDADLINQFRAEDIAAGGSGEGIAFVVIEEDFDIGIAVIAERFFGNPSKELVLIGITGTNGKTTTAHLVQHLLNTAGTYGVHKINEDIPQLDFKCGLIGTVCIHDGKDEKPASLTTPFAIDLSRTLAVMVENGCNCAVMEISSHALAQNRVAGLEFKAAVFTNLSGDHLDYHSDMEEYATAKAKLFEMVSESSIVVVNSDDPATDRMLRNCKAARIIKCRVYSEGEWIQYNDKYNFAANGHIDTNDVINDDVVDDDDEKDAADDLEIEVKFHDMDLDTVLESTLMEETADHIENIQDVEWSGFEDGADSGKPRALECWAGIITCTARGILLEYAAPWGEFQIELPLLGRHNVANALQASAIAATAGLTAAELYMGLINCQAPPGRLQRVTEIDEPFTVLVDYAHTDDALDNVLSSVRSVVPEGGRLLVVFGCGGDRDKSKRPRMGEVACNVADVVYVTSDNPRTEDPTAIINDIMAGVDLTVNDQILVEPDRKAAITHCILQMKPGDVLVIAGKGHEDYQIIGTEKHPFSDWLIARRAVDEHLGIGRVDYNDT